MRFRHSEVSLRARTIRSGVPHASLQDAYAHMASADSDTGVSAYKRQAVNLKGSDEILTIDLRIHLIEARHAAGLRLMRG
jgi:hypothetical protein